MIAVTGRTLHFAQGEQRGKDVPLIAGSACVIGSSAALCSVVLHDEDVAPRHCALTLDARGHVTCTALDAAVWVGQRELPPGASMVMPDFLPLCCGQATLLVGPPGSDWSFSMIAAKRAPGLRQRAGTRLQHVRSSNPAVFGALLLGSLCIAAGSVWGAVTYLTAPLRMPADNIARAQRWLQTIAPVGSELQLITDDSSERWVVAGYVANLQQRDTLAATVARQPGVLRAEVHAVDQLMASVARVARREGVACVAAYLGAGRVACDNEISDALAARLRAASGRVEGLRELSLRVEAPPAVAKAAPKRTPSARKFSVLMSNKRGNRLIGPAGEGYREGDTLDGMTIRKIMFDQVVFERGVDEVVLHLAQL
jgi:Inner membrane component of T3SS, cytoplasmic domain